MAKQSSFMLAWTRALLSEYGPAKSTTRFVLLTLATHMNGNGTSCYPSQKTLAAESCMSHVAIYKHLQAAEALGWIVRWKQNEAGRDWALTYYEATFPATVPAEEFDPPWITDPTWQSSSGMKRRRYPPVMDMASPGRKQGYVPDASGDASRNGLGTKPHELRQETSANEARNDDKEGTKPRYLKGSIEDSIGGSHMEGAGASARTAQSCSDAVSARKQDTEQAVERIRKALLVIPSIDATDEHVANVSGTSIDQVRRIRGATP